MGKPKVGILDPKFRWVPAAKTDVAKTFERERQRLQEEKNRKNEEETTKVVWPRWKD